MKIVIYEVEDWEKQAFDQLQEEHEVVLLREPLRAGNAGDHPDAEIISAFIYSNLGRDILKQFGNLKFIATRSTGFDHIDLEQCAERDILVANVPTYGENTVAEHVFGLLLTISHNLDKAVDRTRKGDFSPQGLQGFDLEGRTMGVIGTGAIGRCVIRIARGFSMNVVAFDVEPDQEAAERLGFQYVSMDDLLARSDVISLHVPSNPKTRGLLSHAEFDKMKDGVVLINTSRGEIVDVQAMIRALSEGKLHAAGVDVLSQEPVIREEAELLRSIFHKEHDLETLLADHVLLRLRNVIVTPHSAFNTREAVRRILDTTLRNISAFVKGTHENVVNAKG